MSSRDAISPRGSSPSSRAALDARPLPRPQILLVDDDEGLLDTLGAFLRLTGYSVVTVRTYDLAVEHLRSYSPTSSSPISNWETPMGGTWRTRREEISPYCPWLS